MWSTFHQNRFEKNQTNCINPIRMIYSIDTTEMIVHGMRLLFAKETKMTGSRVKHIVACNADTTWFVSSVKVVDMEI